MEKQNSAILVGEEAKAAPHNSSQRVKLMCSYGGKIQPRPHDHQLTYAGGDTKILAVDRRATFAEVLARVTSLCNSPPDDAISFKYQLPGEDLDALVSVVDDDDLEHMMAEYDRVSPKPTRLRVFLFSAGRAGDKPGSDRSKTASSTSPPLNPDFLFGFDKEYEFDHPKEPFRPDFFSGSDPRSVPEMKIQAPQMHLIPLAFERENSHSHALGGGGQVVYGVPSGYQGGVPGPYALPAAVRMVPVYSYFSSMRGAPAAVNGVGAEERGHAAAEDGGRTEAYNGVVGVVSPHQIGDGKNAPNM